MMQTTVSIPECVAAEIELYKNSSLNFDDFYNELYKQVNRVINLDYVTLSDAFVWLKNTDNAKEILNKAWYNGYNIEKKCWTVITEDNGSTVIALVKSPVPHLEISTSQEIMNDDKYWYTKTEIDNIIKEHEPLANMVRKHSRMLLTLTK